MAVPFAPSTLNLSPLEVEALKKRIADLLGEATTRQGTLLGQAGEARTGYEQLATAPAPEVSPIEGGTQQLFGDMASILSRRPEFGERSRQDIKQRGAMLLQQRIQNIQVLRDRAMELAQQASTMDPIKAFELNKEVERYNKLLEQGHEKQLAGFGADEAMKRTVKQGEDEITVANIRAAADKYQVDAARATALGKLPEDKFDERRLNIFEQFKDTKGKGGILKGNRPLAAASLIGIVKGGETSDVWQSRTVQDLENIFGKGKVPKEWVMGPNSQLAFWKSTHFPVAPSDDEGTPTPSVGGAAVTASRSPDLVTIETPTGRLSSVMKMDLNELNRLYKKVSTPPRGPVETAIHQRAAARIAAIVRTIEREGGHVIFPALLLEGIEKQGYTDEFFNQEAK